MSNEVNTDLLERAAEMIDYYEGTTIAKVLQADLEHQDYEALYHHVVQAETQVSQEEFEANDTF